MKRRLRLQARSRLVSRSAPVVLGLSLLSVGCGKRPSTQECGQLLDHYVELLSQDDRKGQSESELVRIQQEARRKAARDPEFAECSERVSRRTFDCAMTAPNTDRFEQCFL